MFHEDLLIQRGIVDSITPPFYKLINLSGTSCKYMYKYGVQKLWIYMIYNINYPRAVYNILQVK